MKKFVCSVCGYVYEGAEAPVSYTHLYEGALAVVEAVDWQRVKSLRTLGMVADVYEAVSYTHLKILYYMSMEFLMGRALGNNLINLTAYKQVQEALEEMGLNQMCIRDRLPPEPSRLLLFQLPLLVL